MYILLFYFCLANFNNNNFIPTYFKNLASVNVLSQTVFFRILCSFVADMNCIVNCNDKTYTYRHVFFSFSS
jgi:hypothetical protein